MADFTKPASTDQTSPAAHPIKAARVVGDSARRRRARPGAFGSDPRRRPAAPGETEQDDHHQRS